MSADAAYKAIVDRLETATGFGAYAGNRIYPMRLPQNPTLPAATYQVISAPREHAMGADEGTVHARVQVDIYDTSYLGTVSGGKRVRTALSRWNGTATGMVVHEIFVENEFESFADDVESAERRMWRRTFDLTVHYVE